MSVLSVINWVIGILFVLCYGYQGVYAVVPFVTKPEPHKSAWRHRFAVLICARNEASVIGNLLDSLNRQDYGPDGVTAFVLADNCTDDTAAVARAHGAVVYERHDTEHVGKGYAIETLLASLKRDGHGPFDAYLVLDADNVLDKGYLTAMNRSLSDGYPVVTSYRDSKNYATNWVSAGNALWFMRESSFLNRSRMRLGVSCTVSGTGFAFTQDVLNAMGDTWPFHLLTEDMEFSAWLVSNGYRVGYCEEAVLFDEQPETFRQSWRQRLRWGRGFWQVAIHYFRGLARAFFRDGNFAGFDIIMNLAPAYMLTLLAVLMNSAVLVVSLINGTTLDAVFAAWGLACGAYVTAFAVGLLTVISDWKRIYCSAGRKIWSVFTLPIFMLTYIPVAIAVLLCYGKIAWDPIAHTASRTLDDIVSAKK